MEKTDKQKIIETALKSFDFEKVYKVMTFLDWGWPNCVPSISEIIETAEFLLDRVIDGEYATTSTGGLTACRLGDKSADPYYRIAFEITSGDA